MDEGFTNITHHSACGVILDHRSLDMNAEGIKGSFLRAGLPSSSKIL